MNQSCTIISNRIQSKDYLIERIVKYRLLISGRTVTPPTGRHGLTISWKFLKQQDPTKYDKNTERDGSEYKKERTR